MKMRFFWWGIGAVMLALTACRSASQVDFYTLNRQMPVVQEALEDNFQLNDLAVGIGSINLPEYLDRPQIVTLKGPHRLHLSEFHRWAGRLDGEIAQVMANNMAMILGATQVALFPWGQSEIPEYQVDLTFYHLEGVLGQTLYIQGTWSLTDNQDQGKAFHYRFNQEVPMSGPGYDNLADACSRGLWELSRKISRTIAAKDLEKK